MSRICIVGAGMAGLSCAQALVGAGRSVTIFDKGRGPGGRMSARRAEVDGRTVRFDHGAQYFTARDEGFRQVVGDWEAGGVVSRWPAAGADAWVGTPAMNAPIRAMAEGLGVQWGIRIGRVAPEGDGWLVEPEDGDAARFETLAVALPAEQAAILLADATPKYAETARKSVSAPCWTVMAAFAERLPIEADVMRPDAGPVGWAARDSAKPGRAPGERWVVQAGPDWSRKQVERSPDHILPVVLDAFFTMAGIPPVTPMHAAAHRWRYAMSDPPANAPEALHDEASSLAVAGDWLVAPRVEGAWLSGQAAARAILG